MCVFCEIIKGNIPSAKIYEDDDTIAILDLSQATKGHTLIIPKKHSANLLDIDENSYTKAMLVAKKIAKSLGKTYNAKGFNLLNNCNSVAGQTVNHFHIHIIPRYDEADLTIEFVNNEGKHDLAKIANEIKENI